MRNQVSSHPKSKVIMMYNFFKRATQRYARVIALSTTALIASHSFASSASVPHEGLVCLPTIANTPSELDAGWSEAQRSLGASIAAFDEGRLGVAIDRAKHALRRGLETPLERATAHKYLALAYCSSRASTLCKKHFESAIAATPEITFHDRELNTKLHRQLLADARQGMARRSAKLTTTPQVEAPKAENTGAQVSTENTGTLKLDVRPWAEVRLNDRVVAITPPSKTLTLAAGSHRLEFRNPAGPTLRADVRITSGGLVEFAHRF
jgi:hypothetical protein